MNPVIDNVAMALGYVVLAAMCLVGVGMVAIGFAVVALRWFNKMFAAPRSELRLVGREPRLPGPRSTSSIFVSGGYGRREVTSPAPIGGSPETSPYDFGSGA